MKFNNVYLYLLLILFIVIIFICCTEYVLNDKENFDNNNPIPKKIWTFWDSDEVPSFIEKCIQTWKRHNPDFEIIILNNNNYHYYLPELDKSKLKHVNDVRHFSDILRVHVLEKYGGIWSDASIICYDSYDWIIELQKEKDVEFIGYWINNDNSDSPVIENWFFACVAGSNMMVDWKNSLMESQYYSNKSDYILYLQDNADLSNVSSPDYLWMHSALQKCLQENKGKYKYEVFDSGSGPFKFAFENDWKGDGMLDPLIECNRENNCKEKYNSFVKFTGFIRGLVNDSNEDQLF